MGPYGAPAGTVGPRGMELGPYFQTWQLRQQAWQQEQARRQAAEQFARQMSFDEAAMQSREKLAGLELGERRAGREQQRDLAELDVREGRADREAATQRQRAELEARKQSEQANMQREEQRRAEDLKLRDEDIARNEAKEQAKIEREEAAKKEAEKGKLDSADGIVEAGNLWEAARAEFEGRRQGRWGANDMQGADDRTVLEAIANAARMAARRKYANNPAALGAALDEIDRTYQRELQGVKDREMAAEKQRTAERMDAEQQRKETEGKARMTRDEEKLRQYEEQDRRDAAYEQRQDEIASLLAEAAQYERIGDIEAAREVLKRVAELRKMPIE